MSRRSACFSHGEGNRRFAARSRSEPGSSRRPKSRFAICVRFVEFARPQRATQDHEPIEGSPSKIGHTFGAVRFLVLGLECSQRAVTRTSSCRQTRVQDTASTEATRQKMILAKWQRWRTRSHVNGARPPHKLLALMCRSPESMPPCRP